jgi:hypothetical protein
MNFVGVDPGSQGGIAVIKKNGKTETYPFDKDLEKTCEYVSCIPNNSKVVFEKVHAIYGSAASATFSFGRNLGILEGMVSAYGHPFTYVSPKEWQAYIGIPPRKRKGRRYVESPRAWKGRLIEEAKRLYPQCPAWWEGVTYQLAVADALLIAHFLKMNHERIH